MATTNVTTPAKGENSEPRFTDEQHNQLHDKVGQLCRCIEAQWAFAMESEGADQLLAMDSAMILTRLAGFISDYATEVGAHADIASSMGLPRGGDV